MPQRSSSSGSSIALNGRLSWCVDDPGGGWLLVVGGPQFTVFRVEADLSLTALGSFEGEGHEFDGYSRSPA